MSLVEYKPGTAFPGVIGRTFDVSSPAWPEPLRAREGAPNVLFIVQDDTGFGQMGCYGSPIKTPNIDALAANGLLYNNMHTTALCSPTRACVITERNHHSNAMSCITEGSTGYPGGNGYIPFENGWRAVCPWPGTSFTEAGMGFGAPIDKDKLTELDAHNWELYHIAENHNLAAENRAKLIEMIATWYVEAGKYKVLPVDSRGTTRMVEERPKLAADRASFTLYPGTQGVPVNAVPSVLNRSLSITADVDIPKGGAEGVMLSQGGADGGYSLYLQDGKLRYVYNYVGRNRYEVESDTVVPEGRHKLRFEFEVTGQPDIAHGKGAPGRGQLYIDEQLVGQSDIPLTNPLACGLGAPFNCGADVGSPITFNYKPPFKFTGTLYTVTVDVSGELIKDDEAALRHILARQ